MRSIPEVHTFSHAVLPYIRMMLVQGGESRYYLCLAHSFQLICTLTGQEKSYIIDTKSTEKGGVV